MSNSDALNEAGKAVQAGFDAFVTTADNIVTNVAGGFGAVIGDIISIEKQAATADGGAEGLALRNERQRLGMAQAGGGC